MSSENRMENQESRVGMMRRTTQPKHNSEANIENKNAGVRELVQRKRK